jgi:16S rRNA (cytidine1402-2'-O)-methyltransferase
VTTLFLVATPIGNLEDISPRALRVLSEVRLIAAEDTRQTRKLLTHYQIHTPITSYHEHNKSTKVWQVISALEQGDIALVSDAGTPALNDPGFELVRAAIQKGHTISPIPGPCAPIAALVTSGLPTSTFLYLGYLPRKSVDRRMLLQNIIFLPYTFVALEAPHRLVRALDDLFSTLGNRQIAVARELTKIHEEIFRGTILEARTHFSTQQPRGEITLVISGYSGRAEIWPEERLRHELIERLHNGESVALASSQLATVSMWPRRQIYRLAIEIQKQSEVQVSPG